MRNLGGGCILLGGASSLSFFQGDSIWARVCQMDSLCWKPASQVSPPERVACTSLEVLKSLMEGQDQETWRPQSFCNPHRDAVKVKHTMRSVTPPDSAEGFPPMASRSEKCHRIIWEGRAVMGPPWRTSLPGGLVNSSVSIPVDLTGSEGHYFAKWTWLLEHWTTDKIVNCQLVWKVLEVSAIPCAFNRVSETADWAFVLIWLCCLLCSALPPRASHPSSCRLLLREHRSGPIW